MQERNETLCRLCGAGGCEWVAVLLLQKVQSGELICLCALYGSGWEVKEWGAGIWH